LENRSTNSIRLLLAVSAAVEVGAGIAMAVAPTAVCRLLLGEPIDTPAGLVVARLLAAAASGLGLACWLARRDVWSRATEGLVGTMLLYNVAAAVVLTYARFGLGMSGIGLGPVILLHTALAIRCATAVHALRAPAPPSDEGAGPVG